jgi:hypothetical protein
MYVEGMGCERPFEIRHYFAAITLAYLTSVLLTPPPALGSTAWLQEKLKCKNGRFTFRLFGELSLQ